MQTEVIESISSAPKVSESPLSDLTNSNVWVTGDINWMKAHVRHIAIRKPLSWRFKVITDKRLMASWLATAALAGVDILDKSPMRSRLPNCLLRTWCNLMTL